MHGEFITSLQKELSDYRQTVHTGDKVITVHAVTPTKDYDDITDVVTVKLRGERIDFSNFNAGSWSSTWTIDPLVGHLSGTVDIHAHSFENGNIQSRFRRSVLGEFEPNSANSAVMKMRDLEDGIALEIMEGVYERVVNGEIMKRFRRILPISKVKMDWNVNVHRLVKSLEDDVGEGKGK